MALSKEFIEQIQALMPDEAERLVQAIEHSDASVSVRINRAKGVAEVCADAKRVPWCGEGATLAQRPQFTFDPDFQSGRYYVQDASSMFIAYAIRRVVTGAVRYLDLCAAPGGKTNAALSALPEGSLVVANEIVPLRAKILRENVIKWGAPNCVVTHNRPADFAPLEGFFDVIATDVPCSGEGMMRKDDEAVAQWSRALVDECAQRDHSIIDDVWGCLRPGGLLIYSTCTYNRDENEAIVEYIVDKYGAESIDLAPDDDWNIMYALNSKCHCYRFLQHRIDGEGLFLSVLRKPDGEVKPQNAKQKPRKQKGGAKPQPVPAIACQWIAESDKYELSVCGDEVVAQPKAFAAEIAQLNDKLKVLHSGIAIGNIKGKNLVPSHALALSTELCAEAFTQVEVDYATAVAYMRGEAVVLAGAPRGYVLLRHGGAVIGFANNLGNRANNLYPKEWRIRSTHAPEQKPQVVK